MAVEGPTSNLWLHHRISAPLDDPHVGGLSRPHLNPCVPFFSHLMRISKAHGDPPTGDVMFSRYLSVHLVLSFHQKRISQIFGLQFVPAAVAVTLSLWTGLKQCQKLSFISRWRAKHTVLYSAHFKRKLLCLILKHSWSCCRKCCFPWFYFLCHRNWSLLLHQTKCLMFNLVAHKSNPSLYYKTYSVFSIPRHCRDVPVCDFVQLHSGRRVHRTGHAPSERRRGLRGRQGVHNQSRHRRLPLRAEQRKRTHDVTYTAL